MTTLGPWLKVADELADKFEAAASMTCVRLRALHLWAADRGDNMVPVTDAEMARVICAAQQPSEQVQAAAIQTQQIAGPPISDERRKLWAEMVSDYLKRCKELGI